MSESPRPASARSLADWLQYQQKTHPDAMALGLDRVRAMLVRLDCGRPARKVLTIGGTNGKGSTVAFAEGIARQAGLKVGCYTSPHLLRYNERIRIDGQLAGDAALCEVFELIEAARGELPLTFFEWGTLAAFVMFARAGLDLAILEVGLGGRLDAVNAVDADCAVITSVALDHMEHLGEDREAIGREKAGILRPRRPLVLGELDPPDSVLGMAERAGAIVLRRGREFRTETRLGGHWRYADAQGEIEVPALPLAAPCQQYNAACAIVAMRALFPLGEEVLVAGLGRAALPGRMQRIPGSPEFLLDVAHNPHAVQPLAQWLGLNRPSGATHAVFAALADKDAPGLVAPLMSVVDSWHISGLPEVGARAHPVAILWPKVAGLLSRSLHDRHESVAQALDAARAQSGPGDRVVVYGSFHTVAEALRHLGDGTA
ncbi:bifunctional tetrahydrofolate synthase/dihydrofolate synthase [Pseudomarimonas salicorniae]|uniref:Dihydrofolate synthase/folylpolyglutamate synthase n=1 Tax=Pseudomarimonas salicorniae TaxID=2933270 RepID=A0ABT0GH30_9GAMM|nr:bifunctional tetrahydrofolate synthase/dihydrofolate synthase [Lysobacter sp. CAU 1642]MCK7593836.1 bifunctional tetrahydrofolate synthase/dihydrofolate synthase [Lysobacter sp. CAU 1642]